ncbi:MAG: hypothetical protein M0011_08640 [Elusimicrobia bacterium]|nr:hypothetical protein [Elusimicrobiota bacterium]
MKTTLILALLLAAPALRAADPGCAKSADACSAGSKRTSPFVAASLREPLPPATSAAGKTRAAMRQAEPKPEKEAAKTPAPEPASAPAPEVPVSGAPGLSSPLWLLFIGTGVSGLYFYLSGPTRRGKKK